MYSKQIAGLWLAAGVIHSDALTAGNMTRIISKVQIVCRQYTTEIVAR